MELGNFGFRIADLTKKAGSRQIAAGRKRKTRDRKQGAGINDAGTRRNGETEILRAEELKLMRAAGVGKSPPRILKLPST
jgi:hypothetical protein